MSMVTVKLAVVSDTVILIIIIILQVRESASNRLLAFVANCVNALNAYLRVEESLPLES